MDTPTSSDSVHRRRRRRRKESRILAFLKAGWKAWWVEIVVVLLLLLAIFLLVERWDIRKTLLAGSVHLLQQLEALAGAAFRGSAALVRATTLSDLIAYLLLVGVAIVVAWRFRWRSMHSSRLSELVCPRCGGDLHRIHRRARDRALNLFVPVRRYQCKNRDCQWRGLRVLEDRHE